MLVFKCVSPTWRCSGDTAEKTKGEVSQEDWLIEGSAAWRWWVPIWGRHRWDRRGWEREHRSSGGHLAWRDGWSLSFGDGGLIFSKWVLSTAHRGDHAVSELEVTKTNHNQRVMTPSRVVKLILRREATYSSIWFLVSQIRKTIAYKKTPANCLSVNNLNLSVTTNLIIEDSKEKKKCNLCNNTATIHLSLYMTELLKSKKPRNTALMA